MRFAMTTPGERMAAEVVPPPASKRAFIREAFGIAAFGAYFVALHWLVVDARWPRVTLALMLVPWVAAGASFAWRRTSGGRRAVATAGIAIVAAAAMEALALRVEAALFVENIAFDAFLAGVFAMTLRSGRVPLVTRLATAVHGGHLPARAVRYTRRVTAAWMIFFIGVAVVSGGLFAFAPREAWSLFVNLLVWPLVGAMFVVEYAVRRMVLRGMEHASFATTIRAASRDGRAFGPVAAPTPPVSERSP